jgi:hypothetical protein
MRIFYLFILGLFIVTSLQAVGMLIPSDESGRTPTPEREMCDPSKKLEMPFLFY